MADDRRVRRERDRADAPRCCSRATVTTCSCSSATRRRRPPVPPTRGRRGSDRASRSSTNPTTSSHAPRRARSRAARGVRPARRRGRTWGDSLDKFPPCITDREPRPTTTASASSPVGVRRSKTCTRRRPTRHPAYRPARRRGAWLATGPGNGTQRVIGVRDRRRDELRADLVVDAMGRRCRFTDGSPHSARVPARRVGGPGFTYYTRYFRGPSRRR